MITEKEITKEEILRAVESAFLRDYRNPIIVKDELEHADAVYREYEMRKDMKDLKDFPDCDEFNIELEKAKKTLKDME